MTTNQSPVSPRLIIFFIGWLEEYNERETAEPQGGGSANIKGETFNFRVHDDGYCYGFGMTKRLRPNTADKPFAASGVDLNKIVRSGRKYKKKDSAPDIDVFFVATPNKDGKPKGDLRVVGYYKSAIVLHKQYRLKPYLPCPAYKNKHPANHYLCKVKRENAVLIDVEDRKRIPAGLIDDVGRTRWIYADTRPEFTQWLLENIISDDRPE